MLRAPGRETESHVHLHEDVAQDLRIEIQFQDALRPDHGPDRDEPRVPKKQQRITHQRRQRTRRRTLKYNNIQLNDAVDPSLELQSGIGTTNPKEQPTHRRSYHTQTLRHRMKANQTTSIRNTSRRTRISRRGHRRATQKRHGKIGKAKSRRGHGIGKAESRQHRGNTQRHVVHEEVDSNTHASREKKQRSK